ncbi:inositol 1,4,5-triphosphate receptor associated 2-like isoform X2 [Callorhinchus milii]|uniref:EF-hand domain-containing protein n=2 Tax=Callorhinchus milii TaxID=7868 RepID=A0A4W3K1F8_CALMI|nr:inositol 1,4,5-triphosphate receptor associated 2-like isoform X2 [Callorhinchus milii]
MDSGNGRNDTILCHLTKSYSVESFFQARLACESNGLHAKWRYSVDSVMHNKERCSTLLYVPEKRISSFPSIAPHELMSTVLTKDTVENSSEISSCTEEDVLNCTFEACDTEGKGKVSVSRIIEYLEDVTSQSCEKGQLKLLHNMLDPGERGIAVDLETFHTIMKTWIADCRQEGLSSEQNEDFVCIENICILQSDKRSVTTPGQLEGYGGDINRGNLEITELINNIECLEYTNRKLLDQSAKLQRTVEGFEEANTRLTEEIFDLKSKLKSSQQALLHAKLLEDELEDLKTIVKNLEDQNYNLQAQNRQLEKEHQNLAMGIHELQEENGKLAAEKDHVNWRTEELVSEKAELKNQMYEIKRLVSTKDVLLTEKTSQAEELKLTVDEYCNIIKGLKEEISRLQCHPPLLCEDVSVGCGPQRVESENSSVPIRAPQQHSLQLEIEQVQQKTSLAVDNLPTPLCGMMPLSDSAQQIEDLLGHMCSQLNWMDFQTITQELARKFKQEMEALMIRIKQFADVSSAREMTRTPEVLQKEFEEEIKIFLQKISCLFHTKIIWDMYKSKLAAELRAIAQDCHHTERHPHFRNGLEEVLGQVEHPLPEERGSPVPYLRKLKWNGRSVTEEESSEELSAAGRLFRETQLPRAASQGSPNSQRITEARVDRRERETARVIMETRSCVQQTISITTVAEQATQTELQQLRFDVPSEHCPFCLGETTLKENRARCSLGSVAVQLQKAWHGLSRSLCQQQRSLERLYKELVSEEDMYWGYSENFAVKRNTMMEYISNTKYIHEREFEELESILIIIQHCNKWMNEIPPNCGNAARALVPYYEKSSISHFEGTGDNIKQYVGWNVVQPQSAGPGTAEEVQMKHPQLSGLHHVPRKRTVRVGHIPQTQGFEDVSELLAGFYSQAVNNARLICFMVVLTLIFVTFINLLSFIPMCCQKHFFPTFADGNVWSILKAILCPQIRLRHGAPPPV